MGTSPLKAAERDLHHPCTISAGGPCSDCQKGNQIQLRVVDARRRLNEAQEALNGVLEEHREAFMKMNRSHNPVVLQAPPEIASYIFQLCLPPFDFDIPPEGLRDHARLLYVLGAVCHGWRRIALSIPQLWKSLYIPVGSKCFDLDASFLEELLNRSAELPLTLFVYDSLQRRLTDTLVLRVADVLKKHSKRWRNLCIQVGHKHLPLFSNIRKAPSSLMTFQLRCPQGDRFHGELNMECLKPTMVTLYRVDAELLSIQWSELVEADLTSIYLDECYDLLKKAPLVRRCRFTMIRGLRDASAINDAILHSYLEELELDIRGSIDGAEYLGVAIGVLFDHSTFPALQTLGINMDDDDLPSSSLFSLFERSSCDLKALRIADAGIDNDGFLDLLNKISSLETLIIDPLPDHSPSALLRALSKSSTPSLQSATSQDALRESKFLPKLRLFKYYAYTADLVPWRLISPIFGSDIELPSSPRRTALSLHILFTDCDAPFNIDINLIPYLLSIKEAGIDLQILNTETGQDILKPLVRGSK